MADPNRALFESVVRLLAPVLDDPNFIEALGGFLLPDVASQGRRSLLQRRLVALSTP